uniref:Uncharacterized protein n=1 Tax=Tanacetum cinerariifolium TaxID=118510 RepID=A0A699XEH9_TANCI|nr:hypothetical protein [Tanacetum cinerariifolium]
MRRYEGDNQIHRDVVHFLHRVLDAVQPRYIVGPGQSQSGQHHYADKQVESEIRKLDQQRVLRVGALGGRG